MSGIGGGGYMTVYLAKEDRVRVVEFGMRAPFAADPDDYPIVGEETGTDTFNWPRVKGDANVHGPLSTAVPGSRGRYVVLPSSTSPRPSIHGARSFGNPA